MEGRKEEGVRVKVKVMEHSGGLLRNHKIHEFFMSVHTLDGEPRPLHRHVRQPLPVVRAVCSHPP